MKFCLKEEPYKVTLFGKDMDELDVVAADFLPDGKRLYMLVADGDSNLHVLQYDPEGKDWRFASDNEEKSSLTRNAGRP